MANAGTLLQYIYVYMLYTHETEYANKVNFTPYQLKQAYFWKMVNLSLHPISFQFSYVWRGLGSINGH